jgi:tetratricopeptide (TPR) repeat protein
VNCLPFKILLCAIALAMLPNAALSQWYVHYERGLEQFENGEWNAAANSFRAALRRKDKPELNAEKPGLKYIDYLPHYQLGRALFFQGHYAGAMQNFDQELAHGLIRESKYYPVLQRLREMAGTLQEGSSAAARLAGAEKNKEAWLELLNESQRRMQGQGSREVDSLLNRLEVDAATRAQISRWLAQLPLPLPPRSSATGQTEATADSINFLRNSATAAYLQGRYRDAITVFDRLARVAPNEPMLADWQARLRFELSRLDQTAIEPLSKTDTVKIVQSGAPIIVIREPEAVVSRTRSERVHFSGTAHDDVGIAAIELVVNGEPFKLSSELPAENTNGAFSFEADIPLKLGENQIVVTARDLDKEPHSRTELRRIVRQPPLYQTMPFWLAVGSGVVIVLGAIAGNRFIKYRIAFVHRYNPYIAGLPIRDEEMFFGRQQLLERILRTLPNNSLMVFGPRRIGKTSLQYQLQRRLQAQQHPEYHFAPVFIDLQGIAEEVFFAHLIEELREQLGPEIAAAIPTPTDRRQYGHREFANDLQSIITILQTQLPQASGKKIRLVFLIDEVDELNRYSERTNQRLRAIFMKSFSENLAAVLTGSNIRKEWESESSPWYNFFEQVPMPALTRDEAMQLIYAPVKGFYKYEPQAAERIWEVSQGKPFVIQKFCVRLVNLAIEKRRRKITAADVETIRNEVLQDTTPTALRVEA